ncbi:MAG: hypothetical protein LBR87_06390 [Synergistaceae bacterium]|jgi:DNA polymerase-3 subunit delta|nr:hypothetical protein [Synergistaceae bacterium]
MPHLRLLSGPGAALRRLISEELDRLSAAGYEDVRRLECGEWAPLLTENRGRGLFGDRSVILVEEAEKLGVMPERLAPMLEPPGADSVILLVCRSDAPASVPKALMKLCTSVKASEPSFWSRERDDIVISEAERKGLSVSRDALSLLKELFDDTGELASETAKAASICRVRGKKEISAAEVEEFCLSDGSRNLLKLLDGLCSGRPGESRACLGSLSLHSELTPLLSALHNRFRIAMYFSLCAKERASFARALGAKEYASRLAESASRLYGGEKLRNFVTGLVRIASNERSGQGASWRDLDLLVIDLMSGLE